MVLGAQRDAFSSGFAKSTVGTSLLLELARAIMDMKKGKVSQSEVKLLQSEGAGLTCCKVALFFFLHNV